MKISRHKKVKRNLGFYINNYKFRKPYQILIDGTFASAALKNQVNIKDQLPTYLEGETKLLTTQCVISEVQKLATMFPKLHGSLLIIKQFATHICGHEKQPVSGPECLQSMLQNNNESRYIIATNDRQVQDKIRKMAGVPLIYLHGKVPTLDPPSAKSLEQASKIRNGILITDKQMEEIKTMKKQAGLVIDEEVKPKKSKKAKGPNPLSCKKKKKKPNQETLSAPKDNDKIRKKVRRKRIKIAKHIKEMIEQKEISVKFVKGIN